MTDALLKQIELPEAEVASDPYHRAAQNSFEFFRYLMRPQLITGWWVREVCGALQDFYEDLVLRRRTVLMRPRVCERCKLGIFRSSRWFSLILLGFLSEPAV
jgi:hypothetical protein